MLALGIPIGFYGYLFPGTINMMLMELYMNRKRNQLLGILALALLFEALYCIISINLFSTLINNLQFKTTLKLISNIVLLFFGIWMLIDSKKNISTTQNNLKRGILSIIFHPQQIPFWLVFAPIVDSVTPLFNNVSSILTLAFFNCLGVVLVFCFYIIAGSKIITYLKLNLSKLNAWIGLLYICISVFNIQNQIFNFKLI